MNPRLISCYFGKGAGDQWPRLARVLAHTAAEHCPGWDVDITRITPPPMKSAIGRISHVHNTQKMECWAQAVLNAPAGAQVLLIDADTMILRSIDDVWDQPFDMAYTTKPSRFPFNSGVVFFRVSPAVREFVERWRAENRRMLGDGKHHQVWRSKYGGINQAALGYMLDSDIAAHLQLVKLPCLEWNCEDSSWSQFDPAVTRIVHVKSALRRAVFRIGPTPTKLRPLMKRWRQLEEAATVPVEASA
jgi:hypothetical protein